jgi:hypothetical protein
MYQVGAGYQGQDLGRANSLGRNYRPLEKGLTREEQNPPSLKISATAPPGKVPEAGVRAESWDFRTCRCVRRLLDGRIPPAGASCPPGGRLHRKDLR